MVKIAVLKWIFRMIVYEGIFLFLPLLMGTVLLDLFKHLSGKESVYLRSAVACEGLGHMV